MTALSSASLLALNTNNRQAPLLRVFSRVGRNQYNAERADSLYRCAGAFGARQSGGFRIRRALDKVHVGTAVALWAFLPLQVGQQQGIWQKYGIDLEITNNGSDAKLQQAMTAGSIDFGLGSGAAMAFAAKGAPVHAVAAFAGEPRTVTLIVAQDSPIKTPADLKGKLVVMPGVGSVSEWLVWQMAIQQGWGKDGIRTAGQGSIDHANVAAIKTHQADAMTGPPEVGYLLRPHTTTAMSRSAWRNSRRIFMRMSSSRATTSSRTIPIW